MAADKFAPPSLLSAFSGHYELLREAGRGGSASVYVARDLKHDRHVAIKVLDADVGDVSGERFLLEIRVSAGMQHPHILPTYDSGIADGRLYFVMPFVDGGTLRDRLESSPTVPLSEALRITRDIGIALMHAHELGVVHRDVKPENILFYHGVACLADFGIAKVIEQLHPLLTAQGTFVGTPAYMSPEQYAAVGFDGRTDIYSLSCVLFEMIAGTRLFSGSSPSSIVSARALPLELPSTLELPPAVQTVLERGLAPDPEHRFPTARAFVDALTDAIRRVEHPDRVSIPRRAIGLLRKRKIVTAGAALAVVTLASFTWGTLNDDTARAPAIQQGSPRFAPFENGKAAIAAWRIPDAIAGFSAADTGSPATRLWLAQSYALDGRLDRDDFRITALRLRNALPALAGRDSILATALIAFASGQPSAACREYGNLLTQDSLDAIAWFGLGDCQRTDSSVVRDAASPSGWRFSSSYGAAAAAYMRVVSLNPNAHAAVPFAYMSKLLPSSAASIRVGRAGGSSAAMFAAYPALMDDTLGFVPYPIGVFASIARATISPTQPDALERNRDALLGFARHWTVAMPRSAEAWEALSLVRENRGELSDDSTGADGAIRRARPFATSPVKQAQLAAAHVRILVKRGQFAAGRALADSLLNDWSTKDAPPRVSEVLSGIAALTGRIALTARVTSAASAAGFAALDVAPPLAAAAQQFNARAAPGVCDDSLRSLRADFERVLDSYATPSRKDRLRQSTIWQGAAMAFPCLRGAAIQGLPATSPLDRAQQAFAAGNQVLTRTILDSLTAMRVGYKPGDISLDHTVQESWLRAAIGDSAAAERQLDLVLDALPTLGVQSVQEPAQSAAIGRAMVFRADLAHARGNRSSARRWAAAVVELWQGADAALSPTLARMRSLAGP